MQSVLLFFLRCICRCIIKRHRPYVIGVTGTVGKTTLANHIAKFLISKKGAAAIGYSEHHYNGEYGLPLTIIGVASPRKNPFLWLWVFCIGIVKIFRPYPRYLVLEYGIDHPGEMQYLLSIVRPDIAIVTPVEPNHLEQFGTLEIYRQNKLLLIEGVEQVILHESLRQYVDSEAIYYSLGALSDIDASHVQIFIDRTEAIVHFEHEDYPLVLPAIGSFHIENILPLFAIANILDIPIGSIGSYTKTASPESGRSGIISGIHGSILIDGTYNGGYLSIREGINSMRSFFGSHRIIFLIGDMRELGKETEILHKKLAQDILDIIPHDAQVEWFFVGPLMKTHVVPLLQSKYTVHAMLSSREAGSQIMKMLQDTSVKNIVYAKGSQNTIFLEEGLKMLLEDKKDIIKLPRQSAHWMEKKEAFFALVSRR